MEEEKGTKGSKNLSLNGKEEKINLSGQVHNLPCCIKFNGPCIVSQYFKPKLKALFLRRTTLERGKLVMYLKETQTIGK
ncbi:hypothetical protein PVK06_047566 [Gossypium arboreum]|uniref:Uncharacterized protein n=1 Tax=Gossypium arboreum TaxID=29729 RepID=A0ABR0MG79_GOSAR|nr:hypothetical protein PVK06_047566 [Gossypium arboreum]